MATDAARRLVAEFLGTAVLLSVVVGSGIAAASAGPLGVQLLPHALAVGGVLVVLILVLGPISGAHFNPAVTAAFWWLGDVDGRRATGYVVVQVLGGVVGVVATNLMYGEAAIALSATRRIGIGLVAAEALATGGLLLVVLALVRLRREDAIPGAVGAWIAAAIYATASACFANPAVTVSRALTDTWTGLTPASVPVLLAGQLVGLVVAVPLVRWLYGEANA